MALLCRIAEEAAQIIGASHYFEMADLDNSIDAGNFRAQTCAQLSLVAQAATRRIHRRVNLAQFFLTYGIPVRC